MLKFIMLFILLFIAILPNICLAASPQKSLEDCNAEFSPLMRPIASFAAALQSKGFCKNLMQASVNEELQEAFTHQTLNCSDVNPQVLLFISAGTVLAKPQIAQLVQTSILQFANNNSQDDITKAANMLESHFPLLNHCFKLMCTACNTLVKEQARPLTARLRELHLSLPENSPIAQTYTTLTKLPVTPLLSLPQAGHTTVKTPDLLFAIEMLTPNALMPCTPETLGTYISTLVAQALPHLEDQSPQALQKIVGTLATMQAELPALKLSLEDVTQRL